MRNAKTIYSRLKKMSFSIFVLLITFYFAGYGFRNITTQKLLNQEISTLEEQKARIAAERLDLELHVSLLSSDHVDPDYLDELVRKELGFTHPDEIVIFNELPK